MRENSPDLFYYIFEKKKQEIRILLSDRDRNLQNGRTKYLDSAT